MNDSAPSVSVVIPALNAADVLPDAVESIRDQDYENIVEIIVVAGDEATGAAGRSIGTTVIDNPAGSTPTGLNLGVTAAGGDVVVRCDAQARLSTGYVSRAVATLQRTGATNVGGMQIPTGDKYWQRVIAKAMASRLGSGGARYRVGGVEGPAETVYLGVFDRRRLLELGGFDERFVRNQDYELNHRIIEAGGMVWFDPELSVEYRPRGSLRDLWRQYFQYGAAKRQFSRIHPGRLRPRQLAAPALVITLVGSLAAGVVWPGALLVPTAYLLGLMFGSALITLSRETLGIAAALVTMHVAWGSGFWVGGSS